MRGNIDYWDLLKGVFPAHIPTKPFSQIYRYDRAGVVSQSVQIILPVPFAFKVGFDTATILLKDRLVRQSSRGFRSRCNSSHKFGRHELLAQCLDV